VHRRNSNYGGKHAIMNIRVATEQDYPALREVFLETRRQSFHWANREEMALEDFDKQTVDEYIIVAEENNELLGFASLYLPENFIHHLFIHPDFFDRGAGGLLLQASLQKMGRPMRLKCVSANQRALTFYERKGWKKIVQEGPSEEKYWVMVYE